jgi:hypothetical protein
MILTRLKEISITKTLKKKKNCYLSWFTHLIKSIEGHFQRCINGLANEINFVSDRHIESSLSHFCLLARFGTDRVNLPRHPYSVNHINLDVMIKNDTYILIVLVGVMIVMVASLSAVSPSFGLSKNVSPAGDFKKIPPIILQTQNGKYYKFDIDALYVSGSGTGESYVAKNHRAQGNNVQLKRGEQVLITYGHPFGTTDFVKASLLKGSITIQEGPNGHVTITGQNIAFLQDSGSQGSSQAVIPTTVKKGDYKLVILITYSEDMRGYYITNARIR